MMYTTCIFKTLFFIILLFLEYPQITDAQDYWETANVSKLKICA